MTVVQQTICADLPDKTKSAAADLVGHLEAGAAQFKFRLADQGLPEDPVDALQDRVLVADLRLATCGR
jgi:hypothetical protein